jgi:hypothetical protein
MTERRFEVKYFELKSYDWREPKARMPSRHLRGHELGDRVGQRGGVVDRNPGLGIGNGNQPGVGKSDASRRACGIGKNWHSSPQTSSTGLPNPGITAAASSRSCGRKPAMAATRSPATRGSRTPGPKNDSARSRSIPFAVTEAENLRRAVGQRSCSRIIARANPGSARDSADTFLSESGGNWS